MICPGVVRWPRRRSPASRPAPPPFGPPTPPPRKEPPRGPRPPRPYAVPSRAAPACSATSSALGCSQSSQAAAAAPATGPPGPRQGPPASRPPGPPRPMLAAARGPLTRPPNRRPHIRSSPFLRLQCACKQLPLCPSGGAGHASTSGLIHPGVEARIAGFERPCGATPSPPAPVLARFGCASPAVALHRRPPTGTASSRPRENSRSYRACPCTSPRLRPVHA